MFRVKICGVRLKSDVEVVEASGGDAVGFNFFPPSVRYVDPESPQTAALSSEAKSLGLLRVGVFVNESVENILGVCRRVGLDAIQLHGDEPLEVGRKLIDVGWSVVRAVKLPKTEFEPQVVDNLAGPWLELGCHVLLDADAGAAHGGSGKTLHWPSVANWAAANPHASWTLAGGLKPENLTQAIRVSGARSVDTASGVECPRGVKNAGRVQAFLQAARQ